MTVLSGTSSPSSRSQAITRFDLKSSGIDRRVNRLDTNAVTVTICNEVSPNCLRTSSELQLFSHPFSKRSEPCKHRTSRPQCSVFRLGVRQCRPVVLSTAIRNDPRAIVDRCLDIDRPTTDHGTVESTINAREISSRSCRDSESRGILGSPTVWCVRHRSS